LREQATTKNPTTVTTPERTTPAPRTPGQTTTGDTGPDDTGETGETPLDRFTGDIELFDAPGLIRGTKQSDRGHLGIQVLGLGDTNGDGASDLLISAPYLLSGKTSGVVGVWSL
jgi:hypothetical protein